MTRDELRKAVADALEPTIRAAMSVDLDPTDVAHDVSLRVAAALEAAWRYNAYDRNTAGVLAALRGPSTI